MFKLERKSLTVFTFDFNGSFGRRICFGGVKGDIIRGGYEMREDYFRRED